MEPKETLKFIQYISDWEPQLDVFALRYFVPYTATTSALCATYINKYFRKALKLKNQGFISSFLPIVVLPGVLGALAHTSFVIKPVLTRRERFCSVCLEIRSGLCAFATGIVYPGLLAPVSAFVNAERYYTYPLPSVYKEPVACLKEAVKFYKPFLPRLYLISLLQIIGGMAVTQFEIQNLHTVLEKTAKMAEFVEERKQQRKKK